MSVRPRSIGARLALWYAAGFSAALLLLGVAMWFAVQQGLYHAIDESLHDRAEGIRIFIEDHKTRMDQDEVREEFLAHGDLFQVSDEVGRWIHRAEGFSATGALEAPTDREPGLSEIVLAGEPLRVLTSRIEVDGHSYLIQVAAPLRALQRGLHDSLWFLLPLFPVALLVSSAGGYWISRRALAPVDELTRTARSISARNLSQRVAVPASGDELQRLSETLNEMIGRLEAAFDRIVRFTADASHELRTPLAVMRTTAEVALRTPDSPTEQRESLEKIVVELQRTAQLVDHLLLIAKADSGQTIPARRRTNLAAAAGEACTEGEVLARAKGIALRASISDAPIHVDGDGDALRRLFLILIDNAVKYTPSGGSCEIVVDSREGTAIGIVRDDGIGIADQDLPHIFDRFYRVDRARSRSLGGSGLGLAIARLIVESHEGSIDVKSEPGRGSEFSVRLPLAAQPTPDYRA